MPIGGALVKGMIGGALKERAKNIGKTKAGKLLSREGRVMTGQPQPKAQPAQTVQPQQTLAPTAPTVASSGGGGGGGSKFATEKEAALSIKTTTIQVATLLKGSYVLEKEQLKNRRKRKEKTDRKSREGLLEKAKGMVSGFKMPKMPGKGLLDSVFGFVGQLIFGMVMMKLVDFLPTLTKILPTLGRIADWIIGAGIWVVDTLATFINWGYKLVDGMESMVKNIFGEEGAEKFKTFMTNIKDLIAAFLVWKIIGQKIFTAVIKNIKFAFGIAKGIIANAFKIVNFLTGGAAGKAVTAVTQGIGKIAGNIAGRFMGTGAGQAAGSVFKHGAKRGAKRLLIKMLGKTFVKTAQGIFGRVPIVGPLIVGLVSLVSGEPIGKALFKTFGAALGGFLGTMAGPAISVAVAGLTAGIGGLLAPIIMPASVMIGEILGTFVGDMLYGLIFEGGLSAVGKKLKEAFVAIGKKIAAGVNFVKDFVVGGFSRFWEGIPKLKVPDFPEDPPGWIPKFGFGSQEKIWNAFKGGLKFLMGPLSLLMGRELPNLLWLVNPINTTKLLVKSFFPPKGKGDKAPAPSLGSSKGIPGASSKQEEKERKRKEAEEKRKQMIEGVKKKFNQAKEFAGNVLQKVNPLNWFKEDPEKKAEREKKRKEMIEGMKKKFNQAKEVVGDALQKVNPLNWFKKDDDALKKKNEEGRKKSRKITGITEKGYLVGTGDDQREIIPGTVEAKETHARRYARHVGGTETRDASGRLKSQKIFEYDGKKYHPDDPLYKVAVAAAIAGARGDEKIASALHFKLVTANKQGGAKAVIESISTSASYEEGSPEVITLPAPSPVSSEMPTGGRSGSKVMMDVGGSSDPYEALYKGG